MPRALIVQQLFGNADAIVQRAALRAFESVPDDLLSHVASQLTRTPEPYRLEQLIELVERPTEPYPGDPTVAVSPMRPGLTRLPTSLTVTQLVAPALAMDASVCVPGGFDPRLGKPPSTYRSIPLRFDSSSGRYAFDPQYAVAHARRDAWGRSPWNALDLEQVARSYTQGFVLQPFRRSLGSAWEFRWIQPSGDETTCVPAPRTAV